MLVLLLCTVLYLTYVYTKMKKMKIRVLIILLIFHRSKSHSKKLKNFYPSTMARPPPSYLAKIFNATRKKRRKVLDC